MNTWILLVEDDKDIQASLLDLLELEGYKVHGAFDGQQALDILERSEQMPGLILLDLIMDGMDGAEFRRHQLLNPRLATIPVVVMSADDELARLGNDQGICGYLRKPSDISDILQTIKRNIRPAG